MFMFMSNQIAMRCAQEALALTILPTGYVSQTSKERQTLLCRQKSKYNQTLTSIVFNLKAFNNSESFGGDNESTKTNS